MSVRHRFHCPGPPLAPRCWGSQIQRLHNRRPEARWACRSGSNRPTTCCLLQSARSWSRSHKIHRSGSLQGCSCKPSNSCTRGQPANCLRNRNRPGRIGKNHHWRSPMDCSCKPPRPCSQVPWKLRPRRWPSAVRCKLGWYRCKPKPPSVPCRGSRSIAWLRCSCRWQHLLLERWLHRTTAKASCRKAGKASCLPNPT